jgi:hypothetical protein
VRPACAAPSLPTGFEPLEREGIGVLEYVKLGECGSGRCSPYTDTMHGGFVPALVAVVGGE